MNEKDNAISGIKLMSVDEFFAMLGREGNFMSYAYSEDDKKCIIRDFEPVLVQSLDPLRTHLEDILASAELKEVRVYPKNEVMYLRVNVRFLTDIAEWSGPYQMIVAWDYRKLLLGYAFPVGKGRDSSLPVWLEMEETVPQRKRRIEMAARRMAS